MEPYRQLEAKGCPVCAEEIPAAAKICPRCRQWLSPWSFRHPLFHLPLGMAAGLVIVLLIGAALKRVEALLNPPPYYSDFKDSIHILKADMNWVETTDGPRLFLTGILTNESPITWRAPEFECRFFNSHGKLIDAANGSTYLTVLGGADSAFRVSVRPGLSSNKYSAFQISVSNARNAKGML